MPESNPTQDQKFRIRREAENVGVQLTGLVQWGKQSWREKRWFRLAGYALGAFLALWLLVWILVARDLPSADKLLTYQPPLPTMVRGVDGEIVYSYARERRVQLRFDDFPKPLVNAYLAAEDKTFWSHGGVDLTGLAGAVVDYAGKIGTGARAKGGSTITQQVAKNILIGDEYSVTRKLKEMILARRIESVLTKQQILELYLNEIPLGRQSFGVQAASRAYFGKDVGELQLHEAAFLAILPKAPERYGRTKHVGMAIDRRNYVLSQMVTNGWATQEQASQAQAMPLGLIPRQAERWDPAVGYFVEEVRRHLITKYGEKAEEGPHSIYAGGLWVRTSLDSQLQKSAQDALRAGLLRFSSGKGWRGPIDRIDLSSDNWQTQLVLKNKSVNYKNWRIGAVLERKGSSGKIGFGDGETATLVDLPDTLRSGDVIAAESVGTKRYSVRTIPEVSGGMVVEDPRSGRVMALQGGFDAGLGAFNRATQAKRQPGSTIKPFVYAAGLDAGMTPATMVPDSAFCVYQGARLGNKCFRNFDMRGSGGTHTMRWGLEQSRNLMTVRIANDAGMDRVTRTFDRVGIGKYDRYLSFALGAGETTVQNMVNAYAALANNGVQYSPTLIDYIQDRNGKMIWRADNRRCTGCNMANWNGEPMPRLSARGKQVLDSNTAFQVVHMLQGVVTRGTATVLRDLDLPLFGKTGTTSGPTDVWFVGGSPNLVAGVYLGYDKPRSLGGSAQGGRVAAPIFKQLVQETKPRWSRTPFVAPTDIRMVRIDRSSGKRVFAGAPTDDPKTSIIWEAFKADTEPRRSSKSEDLAARRNEILAMIRAGNQQAAELRQEQLKAAEPGNFAEEQGGLY